jgi:hypothetical protein
MWCRSVCCGTTNRTQLRTRSVTRSREFCQRSGSAPNDAAEEVVHPLQDDGVVAGEPLAHNFGGRGVAVAGARRADEYQEQRGDESDASSQSNGRRTHWFDSGEFWKNLDTCRAQSPQVRIADSSSTNAASFSSACTTKRFPSPRCASATKIVRPFESTAETRTNVQPALLRLSAIISQYFRTVIALRPVIPMSWKEVILGPVPRRSPLAAPVLPSVFVPLRH